MQSLYFLVFMLVIGIILILIGKYIKHKLIKWTGIIISFFAVAVPCISFIFGVIDGLK